VAGPVSSLKQQEATTEARRRGGAHFDPETNGQNLKLGMKRMA